MPDQPSSPACRVSPEHIRPVRRLSIPKDEGRGMACTRLFYEKSLLDYNQPLVDGFYDCGRSVPHLPSLATLRAQNPHSGREVILLDTREDAELCATLEKIYTTLSHIKDPRAKVHTLSLLVSNFYGGSNTDLITNTEKGILAMKQQIWSNVLPIGKLQYGVCRHRAVIFKYVADVIGVPCRLVRGDYFSEKGTEGHAWNVVLLDGKNYLCDIMHDPGTLYEEGSEKAEHYKRISKQESGAFEYAGGPGMQSLPVPLQPNHRHADDPAVENGKDCTPHIVQVLREEIAIKDAQLEKLAHRLYEISPSGF